MANGFTRGKGKGNGLKKMPDALSRMDVTIQRLDLLERGLADRSGAANFILKELKADVIQALLKSFSRSKVQVKSGGILRAIQSSTVVLVNGKIRIAFASTTPKDVLKRATSLNYGSVRQPHKKNKAEDLLGGKAKRTFKKITLEQRGLTKREARRFKEGALQVHDGKTLRKNAFKSGSASVVPPKPFYFISKMDKDRIQRKFSALFSRWLERKLKAA